MFNVAIMRSTLNAQRSTLNAYSLPVKTNRYTNYSISCRKNLAGYFLCVSVSGRAES